MKLGIMQPYFFSYLGYWQLIKAVDKYVIYDDVNFIKGGWINRNKILLNGKEKMINLQMRGASSNKLINEIDVLGDMIYNRKLLSTITNCYKKAPYFSSAFPVIEDIIMQDNKNLACYLAYLIRHICEYLRIETELIISSSISKNNALKGYRKVIEICKLLGADVYCNAIGGQKLYFTKDFSSQGIDLRFIETNAVEYKQFDYEFVPKLSIIDIMMFNSTESIQNMLEQYELVQGEI